MDAAYGSTAVWSVVPVRPESERPSQRSLHSCAIHGDGLYLFGGFNGQDRLNDFWRYSLTDHRWQRIEARGPVPSPRDRHVALIHTLDGAPHFLIFAGYNGHSRLNDMHKCNLATLEWSPVAYAGGAPPSVRHSHIGVVVGDDILVFGGYDGYYRNDLFAFSLSTSVWREVPCTGSIPRARYRASGTVCGDALYVFGGHDGVRHMNGVHKLDLDTHVWSAVCAHGEIPQPRDSHVAVAREGEMIVFGGSTGSATNDLFSFSTKTGEWRKLGQRGAVPSPRFCHTGALVGGRSLLILGGYDGTDRLQDFAQCHLAAGAALAVPPSTLRAELEALVGSPSLADVVFIVEGVRVPAHRVLCCRAEYFRALLDGDMREAGQAEVEIPEVSHAVFLQLLRYLYTDTVSVEIGSAMELLQAADRFGVDRLKLICESEVLRAIRVENAATLLQAAESHNAKQLRDQCKEFIVQHFDAVSKTDAFEVMGRENVDLLFEVLRSR